MSEDLIQRSVELLVDPALPDILGQVRAQVDHATIGSETPVRFAVTDSTSLRWSCELGTLMAPIKSAGIFDFRARPYHDQSNFNAVMLVPTGVGASIGGHAGDATPAATLLAAVCDTLITHPNVLNASDLIQIPDNTQYVEGSLITQLMMGGVGLERTRNNRVLVLVQAHEDQLFTNAAINAVNAARAYYGLTVTEVVRLAPDFRMIAQYTPSGSAAGRIEGLEHVWRILDERVGNFDAVAISSIIEVPHEFHEDYYEREGNMINPWGGVEAILTHGISLKYGIPAAHSPMFESREISDLDLGVVDPRMAAEVVSMTFFQSVLRGLQRSPRIAYTGNESRTALRTEDISCLVIPAGCLGLPTLAALYQGIPVVAVKENANIMHNKLEQLPWSDGQLITVNNYWEAAGVMTSLKAGIDPFAVRRPFQRVHIATEPHMGRLSDPVASPLPEV